MLLARSVKVLHALRRGWQDSIVKRSVQTRHGGLSEVI